MAIIGYNAVLQSRELAGIRKEMATLTEQRGRKRKYIRAEESLTVGDVQDLIAEKDGSSKEVGEQPIKRVRARRHCGCCGKTSYNM